jgi:hypothetical protein
VVRLNDNFTGPQEHVCDLSTPRKTEAPVLFKRRGKYYVLAGACCCVCTGGSNIIVMMADSIRGPWTCAGDVGSNPTHFDRHSPNNCERRLPPDTYHMIGAMIGKPLWDLLCDWLQMSPRHRPLRCLKSRHDTEVSATVRRNTFGSAINSTLGFCRHHQAQEVMTCYTGRCCRSMRMGPCDN